MLFTEPSFLFVFLPLVLGLYFLAPAVARNTVLTVASLAFYAFGEPKFVPFMIVSIALNYVIAIWIEAHRNGRWANTILALGIASDLLLLVVFKYARWFLSFVDIPLHSIWLPLGISFFTFHKISYKVDVYRGVTRAQRNPLTLALYILFFPQLIAGPIVRYHDIADQLESRSVRAAEFAEGIRRLIIGLAKKMIIANTVAVVADAVFKLPGNELGTSVAWLGVASYTLQIYFDFSGYSDMAIGLALMFGFRFLENFDHPYTSLSITEFWRRWHISLSRWFRDYLYIPLGGNRHGPQRTYRNLIIVFFLCGLWHGASSVFVIWGLFHGLFLVLERAGLEDWLATSPRLLRRAYALLVVMVGWVFFRADSLGDAGRMIGAMFGHGGTSANHFPVSGFLDPWTMTIFLIGTVFALVPVKHWGRNVHGDWIRIASNAWVFGLLLLSLLLIAAGTYNPFLYFRF